MVSAIIGGVRTASFGASIGTVEAFSLLNRSLVIALPSLSMTIGPRGEEYVAVYVMTRIFGDSFRCPIIRAMMLGFRTALSSRDRPFDE